MAELISVIIPAYNAEKYIERCIRSIQNQTYQNVEIIVVNDGSADGTEAAARRCGVQDARIRVFSQENKGVSAARNRGMEEAKGEYLAFVDADDTLPAEAMEVLMKKLLEERADIVSGSARAIYDDGTVKEGTIGSGIWTEKQALEMSLRDDPHTYSVWGKIYRKEFVGSTRFEEKKCVHEDSFFLFECFQKEPKMVCLEECVYEYHILQNSSSREAFSEKYYDILYFARRKEQIVREQYPQYESLARNMLVKANMAFLEICCKTNADGVTEQEKKCIQQIKAEKKYFVPATKINQMWFRIICLDLYYGAKFIYSVREKSTKNSRKVK